jgi:hypothetical protein
MQWARTRGRLEEQPPRPSLTVKQKSLYIEAVAFGLQINLFLGFREFLDLVFDMLNSLDDSSQLITRNPNRSAHGLLLVNMTLQKSAIHTIASSRPDERGKQPINSFRRASASARRLRSSGAVPSTWSRMAEPACARIVRIGELQGGLGFAGGRIDRLEAAIAALGVLAAAASKAVGRCNAPRIGGGDAFQPCPRRLKGSGAEDRARPGSGSSANLTKHRFMSAIGAPRYIPTMFGGGRLADK